MLYNTVCKLQMIDTRARTLHFIASKFTDFVVVLGLVLQLTNGLASTTSATVFSHCSYNYDYDSVAITVTRQMWCSINVRVYSKRRTPLGLNRAGLRNVRTCSAEQGPHTLGAPHKCPKNFKGSKLPIRKTRKHLSKNELVESRHYCKHKFIVCKHEKISSFLYSVSDSSST